MYTYIKTNQFKTNQIKLFYIIKDLSLYNSLRILPAILFNGSKNYPSKRIINNYFEDNFDSSCYLNYKTVGSMGVFEFSCSYIKDKYAKCDLTSRMVDIIKDIIYNPLLVDGYFREDVLENEKRMYIESLKEERDRKQSYAIKKNMLNNAIPKEFKLASFVDIDSINKITKESVKKAYDTLINDSELVAYLAGDIDLSKLDFLDENKVMLMSTKEGLKLTPKNKEIVETLPAKQSVMTMNFITNKTYLDKETRALSLFSHLLGGDANSLLFRRVREEAKLCYYISSMYDNFTGGLMINLGLDKENIDLARKLILEVIDDIKKGNYDELLLDNAKASIKDGIIEALDDPNIICTRRFYDDIYKRTPDVFSLAKEYDRVTKEDISYVASLLELDLTYILKGEENGSN